jgi:hypothetical protein
MTQEELDKRAIGKVVKEVVRNNQAGVDGHYSVAIVFADDTYIEIIGNYGEGVTLEYAILRV